MALSVKAIEIFGESVAKTSNQERIPEYNHPEVGGEEGEDILHFPTKNFWLWF